MHHDMTSNMFSEVEGQICPDKVDVLAQKMKERVSNFSYAIFPGVKLHILSIIIL